MCTNERASDHPRGSCKARGSEHLLAKLKTAVAERGLQREIRVQKAGCLDSCEAGPCFVVYPDNVWYGGVRSEQDIQTIAEEHLAGDQPVNRLQLSTD